MTPRLRSLLFTPADSPRKMAKGATLPADAIIADLEDAVAPSRKLEARALLVHSFRGLPERPGAALHPHQSGRQPLLAR